MQPVSKLPVVPNILYTTNLYSLLAFQLRWYCFSTRSNQPHFLNGTATKCSKFDLLRAHYTLLQLPLEETAPQDNTSMGPCVNNLQTVASTSAQSTSATDQSRSSALQTPAPRSTVINRCISSQSLQQHSSRFKYVMMFIVIQIHLSVE